MKREDKNKRVTLFLFFFFFCFYFLLRFFFDLHFPTTTEKKKKRPRDSGGKALCTARCRTARTSVSPEWIRRRAPSTPSVPVLASGLPSDLCLSGPGDFPFFFCSSSAENRSTVAVSLKIHPDQPIRNVAEVLPEVYSEPEYETCKVYGAHEHGLHIRTAGSSNTLQSMYSYVPPSRVWRDDGDFSPPFLRRSKAGVVVVGRLG